MSAETDFKDVTLQYVDGEDFMQVDLPKLIAAGRLFVVNEYNQIVQVQMATYWRDDNLLTVCNAGYEFDEDGEVTRDFR